MIGREKSIDPYNDSQGPSNAPRKKEPKVPIHERMSQTPRAGMPDPLTQALTKPPPVLPAGQHTWTHSQTPQARGAPYNPAGAYGRPHLGSEHRSQATGMGEHTSAPGP